MAEPGDDRLARECRLFCRYLADVDATPDVIDAYRRAHAIDSLKLRAATPLDRALQRLAITGAAFTRLADSFAGASAPRSALRRKLVVFMAILESRGASAMNVDRATPGSLAAWAVTTGLYGTAWLFRCAVGAVLLLPLRLWYGVSASR